MGNALVFFMAHVLAERRVRGLHIGSIDMRQTCLSLYSCILSHVLAGNGLRPDEQAAMAKTNNALCLDRGGSHVLHFADHRRNSATPQHPDGSFAGTIFAGRRRPFPGAIAIHIALFGIISVLCGVVHGAFTGRAQDSFCWRCDPGRCGVAGSSLNAHAMGAWCVLGQFWLASGYGSHRAGARQRSGKSLV